MSRPEQPPRDYPLPQPAEDPRLTLGLVMGVADALVAHGYPPFRHGADMIELHLTLFRFLYRSDSGGRLPSGEGCAYASRYESEDWYEHDHGECQDANEAAGGGPQDSGDSGDGGRR